MVPPAQPVLAVAPQNMFAGVVIWMLFGAFGGYAYWSGHKLKACARVALWIALVGSITLVGAAERAAGAPSPPLGLFLFAISVLMICLLWAFDLVHLLRHWPRPARSV